MKKNITINLFGSLYAIDEDAYELLKKYEDNIRAYFAKQEGGDEIVDDIERRVAELFEEYKANGLEAISIEHVQDIIGRIGNPEQMDAGDDGEATAEAPKATAVGHDADTAQGRNKKLFRDPKDKMLGGVMAGLAHFFGCDPLPLRLLILFLCIFTSGAFLFVYIVLWIIVPQARTAEDFLRMNGQVVTPEGIGQTVVDGQSDRNAGTTMKRHGFDGVLEIIMLCMKIVLYTFGFLIFLSIVACLLAAVIVAVVGVAGVISEGSPLVSFVESDIRELQYLSGAGPYFWILIVSCILSCGIPVFCIVHHIMRVRRSVEPMSIGQRLVWLVVWIVSFSLIVFSGVMLEKMVDKAEDMAWDEVKTGKLSTWVALQKACSATADSTDFALWQGIRQNKSSFSQKYHYEEVFYNAAPGEYRISTQAYADEDAAYLYAYTYSADSKQYAQIESGDPEDLMSGYTLMSIGRKKQKGKTKMITINKNTKVTLPTVTLESIMVPHRGDVHVGIVVNKDEYSDDFCQYLLFNKNFKLERIRSFVEDTILVK